MLILCALFFPTKRIITTKKTYLFFFRFFFTFSLLLTSGKKRLHEYQMPATVNCFSVQLKSKISPFFIHSQTQCSLTWPDDFTDSFLIYLNFTSWEGILSPGEPAGQRTPRSPGQRRGWWWGSFHVSPVIYALYLTVFPETGQRQEIHPGQVSPFTLTP